MKVSSNGNGNGNRYRRVGIENSVLLISTVLRPSYLGIAVDVIRSAAAARVVPQSCKSTWTAAVGCVAKRAAPSAAAGVLMEIGSRETTAKSPGIVLLLLLLLQSDRHRKSSARRSINFSTVVEGKTCMSVGTENDRM